MASTSETIADEHESKVTKTEPIFRNISADDPNPEITEIESACMNCFQTGHTRILLTKIPFYKEVVIMSFKCENCGFENNEIQSASEIQEKGVHIILKVNNSNDLNRRIVRSDYTSVRVPEVELEVPSQSQKGEITTVEGVIDRVIRGLCQDQEKRKLEHPNEAAAIDAYIFKLTELKELKRSFTIDLRDISGNSFIENPNAPAQDHNCKTTYFVRTKDENHILGIYDTDEVRSDDCNGSMNNHLLKPIEENAWPLEELHSEVLQFPTICFQCRSPCETNMKMTNIPHFKDVVIMATVCDVCGHKTNEVKSGGGIEQTGIRFKVRVESKDDLSRDVLKSETCSLEIPELECHVGPYALGGRFTTVEGILVAMKEQLEGDGVMFHDSCDDSSKLRMANFLKNFEKILNFQMNATLILDDPAGNSYVQSLRDDDEPDDKLVIEKYERTYEHNEELGLNDMKTENYS